VVRTLIGGVPTQPFSMAGLPPLGSPNKGLGDALKQLSAAKYGRPKSVVESEIFARLATKDDGPPAAGTSRPRSGMAPAGQTPGQPPAPKSSSSFLDEWLNKKQTNSFKMPASPFKGAPGQTTGQAPMPAQLQVSQPLPPVAAPQPVQMPVLQTTQPLAQMPPAGPAVQPQAQSLSPIQAEAVPAPASTNDEGVLLLRPTPKPIPTLEEALANSGEIKIDDNGQLITSDTEQ